MKTISDDYRKLNEQLHAENASYGTSGARWADEAIRLARAVQAISALDYGAGKGTLAQAIGQHPEGFLFPPLRLYDPAVPDWAKEPDPADLVVCTDVLEHIEPDRLHAVILDLKRVTRKVLFATVHNGPARKVLADGRNAHLSQHPPMWWLRRMMAHFDIVQFGDMGGETLIVARPQEVTK